MCEVHQEDALVNRVSLDNDSSPSRRIYLLKQGKEESKRGKACRIAEENRIEAVLIGL